MLASARIETEPSEILLNLTVVREFYAESKPLTTANVPFLRDPIKKGLFEVLCGHQSMSWMVGWLVGWLVRLWISFMG